MNATSHRLLLICLVAGSLFLFVSQGVILTRLGLGPQDAWIDAALFTLTCGLSLLAFTLIFRFYQPATYPLAFRLVVALTLSSLSVWLFVETAPWFHLPDESYDTFVSASVPLRLFIAALLLGAAAIASWLWAGLAEKGRKERQVAESEKLLREAELLHLRLQLQPHFLFNSLNSINALVVNEGKKAREMILQLSDFLRGTLRKDEAPVKFSEELNHLSLYLSIEKLRFGHRLSLEIDTGPDCDRWLLPPLILQPLVENSIKFGLYGTTRDVTIRISARCRGDFLELSIENPCDSSAAAASGTGFGLSSVRRRLFLIYGRNDLLSTYQKDEYFTTTLKIPKDDTQDNRPDR